MKYYLMVAFMAFSLSVNLTSCSPDDPIGEIEQPVTPNEPDNNEPDGSEPGGAPNEPDNNNPDEPGNNGNPNEPGDNNGNTDNPMSNNFKISIGEVSFNVTLENNATATAFKALLPMTIDMSEMNGNEKYYYLPGSLPTASSSPGTIHTGDLMLYGSSCVVLFYETFSSSYSYTRIGKVDNPSGLSEALGRGNVSITFEIQDKE